MAFPLLGILGVGFGGLITSRIITVAVCVYFGICYYAYNVRNYK